MKIFVVYWYNKQMVMPSAIPNNMVMKWDNCAKTLNVIYHSLFYNLFIGRYILIKGKGFSFSENDQVWFLEHSSIGNSFNSKIIFKSFFPISQNIVFYAQ